MTCDITTVPSSADANMSNMMNTILQAKADMCATNQALGGGKPKKHKQRKSKKQKKTKSKKHKQRKSKKHNQRKTKKQIKKVRPNSNPNLKSRKNIAKINKLLKSIERMKKREKSESNTSAVQYPLLSIF